MGTAGLTAPDKHSGSYLFLTLADPATRRGVVAGWLTHDRGDGVLFSGLRTTWCNSKPQIDYGHLRIPPGKSAKLETLVVGIFDDARIGQELFADEIKKHYDIKLRPQTAGFCTWYSEVGGLTDKKGGAGACNEKDLAALTEFAARELKPFGFGFVQIDDEWQDGATKPDGSRINGPRRGFTRHKPDGGYPNGMEPVARNIREHGLTAGIWFLPFARNHQDPEYAGPPGLVHETPGRHPLRDGLGRHIAGLDESRGQGSTWRRWRGPCAAGASIISRWTGSGPAP